MAGIIIKSTNNYSEVISGNKTLLYKHNSSPGLNVSCFSKLLDSALNWNITPTNKLIDLMTKIPKEFISTITVNGDINGYLTPNDITFLKDNLNTHVFDDITNIPKHWCVVFYKSELTKYNMLSEKFGNDDVVLEVKTTELLEKTKSTNIIHQTPLDILKKRIDTLEEKNIVLEKMLNDQSVEMSNQIIETTKKIEESHDIYNKFIDTIEEKLKSLNELVSTKTVTEE
jgi:hypothetical protein